MREILFKAKRVDNGEWVVGQYVNTCYPGNDKETGHFIAVYPNEYHEIYTSTICQFTGLCDKNGNKIWENDIVTCQTKYGGDIGKIVFHNGKFCVLWNSTYHYSRNGKCENYYDINTKNSVKGNVFDNPELLQEESDE
jgi:uncharacterized phage protein (TIGR01671 family)